MSLFCSILFYSVQFGSAHWTCFTNWTELYMMQTAHSFIRSHSMCLSISLWTPSTKDIIERFNPSVWLWPISTHFQVWTNWKIDTVSRITLIIHCISESTTIRYQSTALSLSLARSVLFIRMNASKRDNTFLILSGCCFNYTFAKKKQSTELLRYVTLQIYLWRQMNIVTSYIIVTSIASNRLQLPTQPDPVLFHSDGIFHSRIFISLNHQPLIFWFVNWS